MNKKIITPFAFALMPLWAHAQVEVDDLPAANMYFQYTVDADNPINKDFYTESGFVWLGTENKIDKINESNEGYLMDDDASNVVKVMFDQPLFSYDELYITMYTPEETDGKGYGVAVSTDNEDFSNKFFIPAGRQGKVVTLHYAVKKDDYLYEKSVIYIKGIPAYPTYILKVTTYASPVFPPLSRFHGLGTEENPYRIMTVDDYNTMAKYLTQSQNWKDAYFKLANDIDFTDVAFTPLAQDGVNNGYAFEGILDGDGYSIQNLKIEGNDDYVGFVAILGENGVVKNLTIDGNCSFSGNSYVAPIVAINNGTVENCANYASYSGQENVGGIIGYNADGALDINNIDYYQSTPTAITHTPSLDENSTEMYDLTGRKITRTPAHGIYIENGRKVLK